jgi:hypothetical protein
MDLFRVSDRKTEKMFLDTARFINRNDKTWVCLLDNDIQGVFDPHKNTYFKHGIAERWVLADDENRLTGRIAAFIDFNLARVFRNKPHYTEIEFSWVADFNPKMRKTFIAVGCIPVKDYITYRYLFDRSKEFKRYPIHEI